MKHMVHNHQSVYFMEVNIIYSVLWLKLIDERRPKKETFSFSFKVFT